MSKINEKDCQATVWAKSIKNMIERNSDGSSVCLPINPESASVPGHAFNANIAPHQSYELFDDG